MMMSSGAVLNLRTVSELTAGTLLPVKACAAGAAGTGRTCEGVANTYKIISEGIWSIKNTQICV